MKEIILKYQKTEVLKKRNENKILRWSPKLKY